MNKEEILKKSREEGNDEGLKEVENNGRKLGEMAFTLVFIFILIINSLNGKSSYAPMAMFWAFLAAEAYPKFKFTKQKVYLISIFAGSIANVAYLINFVIETIG